MSDPISPAEGPARRAITVASMIIEQGWVASDQAAGWIAQHRDQGHHPRHNPDSENPERWDCDCGGVWRILTPRQITQKFAHLEQS